VINRKEKYLVGTFEGSIISAISEMIKIEKQIAGIIIQRREAI